MLINCGRSGHVCVCVCVCVCIYIHTYTHTHIHTHTYTHTHTHTYIYVYVYKTLNSLVHIWKWNDELNHSQMRQVLDSVWLPLPGFSRVMCCPHCSACVLVKVWHWLRWFFLEAAGECVCIKNLWVFIFSLGCKRSLQGPTSWESCTGVQEKVCYIHWKDSAWEG